MTSLSTISHGGAQVYRGMENQFDNAKTALDDLQAQKKAIQNDPNMSKADKAAALDQLGKAEQALMEALDYTTRGGKYDTNSGSTLGDGDMAAYQGAMARAEAAMARVESQLQTAATNAPPQVSEPPKTSGTSATSGAGSTSGASGSAGAGGASGANAAGSGGGLGALEFGGKSVDEIRGLLTQDPQAAMAHLNSLSDEDRRQAFQMIMARTQELNQMYSMMSNLMKAEHDTAKALINNMRV